MIEYYKGTETQRPLQAVQLKPAVRSNGPEGYTAAHDLAAAVNVALILGKPLLVTGEPGTGKTELAGHVAMALGLEPPERFDTRSSSQASELFYRFDSLSRFHWANRGSDEEAKRPALEFVTFGPLGNAILRSLDPGNPLFEILGMSHPSSKQVPDGMAKRSVVLIDEIDKAPRDFPNDLLDAIDHLRFSIRELEKPTLERLVDQFGSTDIAADPKLRPVVIITSNSEKNLPPAFLRRCVYFHIPFPDPGRLRAIVARRIGTAEPPTDAQTQSSDEKSQSLLRDAVAFFEAIRALDLRKRPSTAELIDWMQYLLKSGAHTTDELTQWAPVVHSSLGILVKSVEDFELVRGLAKERVPLPKS